MKQAHQFRALPRRQVVLCCALVLLSAGMLLGPNATVRAVDNPITLENQQPGTDAWRLGQPGFFVGDDLYGHIKGYASATSVNKGESIDFLVSANPVQDYTIDIYRMGWYGGSNGRLMQHIDAIAGVPQPACLPAPGTGLIECNWSPGYTLQVPATWTSGIYLAQLTNRERFQNYIIFVVRDDGAQADILYQQSVNTYQAYNNYPNDRRTGKSLYPYNSFGAATIYGDARAVKVSFDRPYALYSLDTDNGHGSGQFLVWELRFVSWLERSGYNVAYSTDVDTHAAGQRLLNYRGFLSVGHDEYWSRQMYDAVETARDAGTNLAFFGGNDLYWQVRFEPSTRGVPNRIMVCYKLAGIDPVQDARLKTVRWRDAPLNRSEQSLLGIMYTAIVQNNATTAFVVDKPDHWIYTGTGVRKGDRIPGVVGYETDRLAPGYPRARGNNQVLLSQSPLVDTAGNTQFSQASVYEAASGARVFAAGTIAWSWGLDKPGVADARLQRMTANILNNFLGRSLTDPLPTPIRVITPTPLPPPTPVVEMPRCFAETGQCLAQPLASYWDQNGGLPVFGFPITAAVPEPSRDTGADYLTQWFERTRFEAHLENAPPYDVLLGRLGADRLLQLGVDWQLRPRDAGPQPGCLWFEQSGFNVCDQPDGTPAFLQYWQTHGLLDPRLDAYSRSLALFGLPITEPRIETNSSGDTVLTQWFERACFEYHPGSPEAGTPGTVLLGLLGSEVRSALSPPQAFGR